MISCVMSMACVASNLKKNKFIFYVVKKDLTTLKKKEDFRPPECRRIILLRIKK